MKICIIGDSHCAMLVAGAKQIDLGPAQITTFAQPGGGPRDVLFDGTVVTAASDKLKDTLDKLSTPHSLDLAEFDAIILAMKTATVFAAFEVLKTYRVSDWASTASVFEAITMPTVPLDDTRLITAAALETHLAAVISENLCHVYCAEIRQRCRVPIFIVRNPLLAEHTLQHNPHFYGLKRTLQRGDGAEMCATLDRAHAAAFAPFEDVHLMRQPDVTVTQGCLTKEEYGRESIRLASTRQHPDNDFLHAGPELGAMLMKDIIGLYRDTYGS